MSGQPAAGQAAPGPRETPGLRGCPHPLNEAYDTALLDLDGVVYLGGSGIPGAAEALHKAAASMAARVRDQQRVTHPSRHR